MRILVLNYEYPPLGGGAGPVCRQLCEIYAKRGHSVDVITMHYRGLPRREVLNGVNVVRVRSFRRRQATCETLEMLSYVVSALPLLLLRLANKQYDVAHVHFIIPTGLLAWAATRVVSLPFIITAHGSDIPGFNPDRFTSEHRYLAPMLRRIGNAAAKLIAPSEYLKDLIDKALQLKAVQVVPNGIDVNRFVPKPKERRVLMTGRLLPRKGFQYVLQALENVETDFEVHIAGDGPMRDELQAIAAKLKCNVTFHGWLHHDSQTLKMLYETCSIFCLPSERENASIALLEAMLAQMAVITTNVSGCPETVGDTALLVSPGDVPAIRTALFQLFEDEGLCRDLGQRARQRVLERFDWETIAGQYLDELNAAMRAANPSKF